MLILTPEGRYYKSAGGADVTTCEPLAADSPYQIGSNTRMMTGAIQQHRVRSAGPHLSWRRTLWMAPLLVPALIYGELFRDDATLAELTPFRELDYGEGGGIFTNPCRRHRPWAL